MKILISLSLLILIFPLSLLANTIPSNERSQQVIVKTKPQLIRQLSQQGLKYGAPVFIRIFKEPAVLELWVKGATEQFELFKTYNICYFSGDFGPKQKEGDMQSPEGFYFVTPNRLNPWSRYHLSFNLGYPNKYDRAHQRTGSALMVHGNCVSIGCYAMTDEYINEIYTLSHAAFEHGQAFVRVHAFPFKLETKLLEQTKQQEWYPFWLNLKEGYDYFERYKRPPNIEVVKGRYVVTN